MTSESGYYTWEEREQWYIDKFSEEYRKDDPGDVKKKAAFGVLKTAINLAQLAKPRNSTNAEYAAAN